MVVPSAMFIEAADDQLANVQDWVRKDQIKELEEAKGTVSDDFKKGYELGLQTARAIIQGNVAIAEAKINIDNIL